MLYGIKKKICTYKQMRFKAGIIRQGKFIYMYIRSQCTCQYDVILIVAARCGSNGFWPLPPQKNCISINKQRIKNKYFMDQTFNDENFYISIVIKSHAISKSDNRALSLTACRPTVYMNWASMRKSKSLQHTFNYLFGTTEYRVDINSTIMFFNDNRYSIPLSLNKDIYQ